MITDSPVFAIVVSVLMLTMYVVGTIFMVRAMDKEANDDQ